MYDMSNLYSSSRYVADGIERPDQDDSNETPLWVELGIKDEVSTSAGKSVPRAKRERTPCAEPVGKWLNRYLRNRMDGEVNVPGRRVRTRVYAAKPEAVINLLIESCLREFKRDYCLSGSEAAREKLRKAIDVDLQKGFLVESVCFSDGSRILTVRDRRRRRLDDMRYANSRRKRRARFAQRLRQQGVA